MAEECPPQHSLHALSGLLQHNLQLQAAIQQQKCALQRSLQQLLELQLKSANASNIPDYASQQSRYQRYLRDAAVLRHGPFHSQHEAPPHAEESMWSDLFTQFPSPATSSALAQIEWSGELDDVLLSAVDNYTLGARFATTSHLSDVSTLAPFDDKLALAPIALTSECPPSRHRHTFGLSLQEWNLVADWFNTVLATDSCLRSRFLRPVSNVSCMLRFGNILRCSTATFTPQEDKSLGAMVDYFLQARANHATGRLGQNNAIPWSVVADHVSGVSGCCRSPFQCASRYQRALNEGFLPPTSVTIAALVRDAQAREAVLQFGPHNWGVLCLAFNNEFRHTPASRSDRMFGRLGAEVAYWVPLQRIAIFAQRLHMSILDEARLATPHRRTMSSMSIALLALYTTCYNESSIHCLKHVSPTGMVKLFNDRMSLVGCTDHVSLSDFVSAKEVCCEKFGLTTTLTECAALLGCTVSDVRTIVLSAWMQSSFPTTCFKQIATRVFGRPQYVSVVRTIVLEQLLSNEATKSHKLYPLGQIKRVRSDADYEDHSLQECVV